MGNCVVHQHKVVRIIKMDGKILEYQTPIKVHQVLSGFAGHAIFEALPVRRCLCPETQMEANHVYYLVPPPIMSNKVKIRASTNTTKEGTNVLRVKLVVTKQELRKMLSKGGVSVDEMLSQLQTEQTKNDVNGDGNCRGWTPALKSIPE